jgi:hypothetical protein
MVTVAPNINYSPAQWRRQILAHRDPNSIAGRIGFVAATFIDRGNMSSALVPIDRVSVVLLFEDFGAANSRSALPLRLVSYRANRVKHGARWGGSGNSQLFKNLRLPPRPNACGQRIDKTNRALLSLALQLDRRLSVAARHPAAPWRSLRLPRLWAGFDPRRVNDLCGQGPEFEDECLQRNEPPATVLRGAARTAHGLRLYPLDWVSDQLDRAAGVFAELTLSLRRQVFRVDQLPRDLIGFQGACAFDFFHSRYRRMSYRNNAATEKTALNKGYRCDHCYRYPLATSRRCQDLLSAVPFD